MPATKPANDFVLEYDQLLNDLIGNELDGNNDVYAFVDETGNTGGNIFDKDQPDFLTAALVTKSDFDKAFSCDWKALCRAHGQSSIHANRLGFETLDASAPGALKILKKADARFFLARVEKRYLLATKIFDTFFDSGENPAVPFTAYNIRALRMVLCFKVASLVDEGVGRQFWTMLLSRKEKDAVAMMPAICETLLDRIWSIPDERSQKVISDALVWARDHPEAFDVVVSRRHAQNNHMPNFVAFTNLVQGLEIFSTKWRRELKCLLHDRQSQFEKTFREYHKMVSGASDEPVRLIGEKYSLKKIPGSNFLISASDVSPGIQVADLILWLFKQAIIGKEFPPASAKLLNFAMRKGWNNDFSFAGVERALSKKLGPMMAQDFPAVQMERAREIVERVEADRKKAIEQYELDEVSPYRCQWDVHTEVATRLKP